MTESYIITAIKIFQEKKGGELEEEIFLHSLWRIAVAASEEARQIAFKGIMDLTDQYSKKSFQNQKEA